MIELNGGSSQEYIPTELGGRYVDQLSNNIARESKVGYTCLSKRIQLQVMKDAWLLGIEKVEGVEWHFFRSAINGRIGASTELLDLLTRYGIRYVIHSDIN